MDNRINKPRAFLSHAKVDIDFINRIVVDLRRCQIEPWLDSEMIRDGKPWLKVIFEDGIPSCDVVIAYFTENSLNSEMVAKEIDAVLIAQLKDRGISFLPYVSSKAVREKLRLDIRSLQAREWNSNNYIDILPSVVAEIWRSYHDRIVELAILQEKNKRLELEILVKKLQERTEETIFTVSEEKDFKYIYSKLMRTIKITADVFEPVSPYSERRHIRNEVFEISILFLALLLVDAGHSYFSTQNIMTSLEHWIASHIKVEKGGLRRTFDISTELRFSPELWQYGLTKSVRQDNSLMGSSLPSYKYEFTDKMQRFRYWLEYTDCPIGEPTLIRD